MFNKLLWQELAMGLPALAVCAVLLPTIQAGRLSTEAVALLERAASPALGGVAAPWPGAGFLSSATSALVAYAYASRSCGRATREFEASLRYQRADGLVPAYAAPDAAAFAAAGSGLPPLAFWNATGALEGPAAPLAALPLHAVAALQIYRGCGDRELASAWAARMAPKLYAWHRFLRVWTSNLQPDFNVSLRDSFDASASALPRELDESNRFVQKSAESTSM